jgi:hypothetical protein
MHARTHTIHLWAFLRDRVQETDPTALEIDDASLSTKTSPRTEENYVFNKTPKCQTWDLNSGRLSCHCPLNHPNHPVHSHLISCADHLAQSDTYRPTCAAPTYLWMIGRSLEDEYSVFWFCLPISLKWHFLHAHFRSSKFIVLSLLIVFSMRLLVPAPKKIRQPEDIPSFLSRLEILARLPMFCSAAYYCINERTLFFKKTILS